MGSNALQIITEAFRHHNLNEVTSFSTTQEFPYKIARDIINEVIRAMNRLGNYWFTEQKVILSYTPGQYAYDLQSLSIDPKGIIRMRVEATNQWANLQQLNWAHFQKQFRNMPLSTGKPLYWSKYGNTLELNAIADQDYQITIYHFKDMPQIETTTDTFLLPERDEDVLIECCYQLLGYKMGRWDYGSALTAMKVKITPLLADMKQDVGIPHQMPAAF